MTEQAVLDYLRGEGADVADADRVLYFHTFYAVTEPTAERDGILAPYGKSVRALLILAAEESHVVRYGWCPLSKRWMCYRITSDVMLGTDGVTKWEALVKLVEAAQ